MYSVGRSLTPSTVCQDPGRHAEREPRRGRDSRKIEVLLEKTWHTFLRCHTASMCCANKNVDLLKDQSHSMTPPEAVVNNFQLLAHGKNIRDENPEERRFQQDFGRFSLDVCDSVNLWIGSGFLRRSSIQALSVVGRGPSSDPGK